MKLSQSGLLIWDVEFLKIKTKNWLNEPSQNIQTQTSHHDLIPTERISKQRNDELSVKSEREPAWTSRPQSPTESFNKSNTSLILPPNVLQSLRGQRSHLQQHLYHIKNQLCRTEPSPTCGPDLSATLCIVSYRSWTEPSSRDSHLLNVTRRRTTKKGGRHCQLLTVEIKQGI